MILPQRRKGAKIESNLPERLSFASLRLCGKFLLLAVEYE
jgi:hypothetical protein